ncbi:hypothetical protein ACQJ6S_07055 [Helicobacter pylori]
MRRGFLDCFCYFCTFRVIWLASFYALSVCKKSFLAVVFSHSNNHNTPKFKHS